MVPHVKSLAKGVDTLELYIEGNYIDFASLAEKTYGMLHDEPMKMDGLDFFKLNYGIRRFPVGLECKGINFFFNRISSRIVVNSLPLYMRGYFGVVENICAISDVLFQGRKPWPELIDVSRIDPYTDFQCAHDFDRVKFSTRLKSRMEADNTRKGKTLYFGKSNVGLMVRLYVKSEEIKREDEENKEYLKTVWYERGWDGETLVWRFEPEYRKRKIAEICGGIKKLVAVDEFAVEQLMSYAVDAVRYTVANGKGDKHNNLHRAKTSPIWQSLRNIVFRDYSITKKQFNVANLNFYRRRNRGSVTMQLVIQYGNYEEIPSEILSCFGISEEYFNAKKMWYKRRLASGDDAGELRAEFRQSQERSVSNETRTDE